MQSKLAIIDDDQEILTLLTDYLTPHGYVIQTFLNPVFFLSAQTEFHPNLIILDVMMPEMTGLELCKQLRQQSIHTPILMLTALAEEVDQVVGLELGADDYLTKPFSPRELLARIRALLRRSELREHVVHGNELTYEFDGWTLEKNRRRLYTPDKIEMILTSNEFNFLVLLLENPNRVLSRDEFLDHFKGREANPFDRSIDVQMSRLRQKLEKNPKQPQLIKTIRSTGYMLTSQVTVLLK
jgi:two-component system OmpR family response regulator